MKYLFNIVEIIFLVFFCCVIYIFVTYENLLPQFHLTAGGLFFSMAVLAVSVHFLLFLLPLIGFLFRIIMLHDGIRV